MAKNIVAGVLRSSINKLIGIAIKADATITRERMTGTENEMRLGA
jgi:hypothetical protein